METFNSSLCINCTKFEINNNGTEYVTVCIVDYQGINIDYQGMSCRAVPYFIYCDYTVNDGGFLSHM